MSIFGGKEARDLTTEIDRETDAAVLNEQETTGAVEADATGTEMAEAKTAEAKKAGAAGIESLAEQARAEAAKTEVHELEQGAGWRAGEVSAETRALGGVALERAVIASNTAVKEQVAVENGYVDTGIEAGRNVIGGESKKQIEERAKDDLENARMETGVDLPAELQGQAEILSRNQESLTKGAVVAIDQLTRQREVKPAQLERQVWQMRMKMLDTMGRKFGERN